MKKIFTALILGILINITVSCQNKQQNTMRQNQANLPKFDWKANVNCPPGYPVEVYRGGLEGNGSYASLDSGTATGKDGWGVTGADVSYGVKTLPRRINCIWVSYAEGCLYSIDSTIDYDKMLEVFQEGYQDSGAFFIGGRYKKRTYTIIMAGFAPGGVVVIWAGGPGRQVEIGRYKGEKYEVPEEEIARLDAHESLLFSKNEYKRIMANPKIVSPEVREANAGKPIPYGLWDNYRVRYTWKPVFNLQYGGKIDDIYMGMYNGEGEKLFDKNLIENKYEARAVPKLANIGWKDKNGQDYGGNIIFDEKEIFDAFNEIFKENKEGKVELQFTFNYTNTFITVQLKQGDKEIRLIKTNVSTYKSTLK